LKETLTHIYFTALRHTFTKEITLKIEYSNLAKTRVKLGYSSQAEQLNV